MALLEELRVQLWLAPIAGAVVVAGTLLSCRVCLLRRVERIRGLWDDIYFRLRERCELVGQLNEQLRKRLRTKSKLADDIEYLLRRMEETNDLHTHAAVQNGLVLTVQTAVEQFHRDENLRLDSEMYKIMREIAIVDSRLAPLRDRFNELVRRYNWLLNMPPFSVVAYLTRAEERGLFAMLIPWWSTDPALYGAVTTEQLRERLQRQRAPLVLAPSQRMKWSGGPRVIEVREKLMGEQSREESKGRAGGGSEVTENGGTRE